MASRLAVTESPRSAVASSEIALLTCTAIATVVIHILLAGRYGFHRDELATLDDARHLAWGYVAYPPLTPFFARISLTLFGTSLAGFRLFAAVAQAVAVVITGLMARELGGRCGAQLVAAAAAIPFCFAGGALMQYVSFDYLFWVLTAYFVVRLLNTDNPRWWLAIGVSIGLGAMTKYTIGILGLGIVASVLLTDARKYLMNKWLWLGAGVSLVIFLPNFIWQAQHNFISLDFLRDIHARDVRIGRTRDFLPDQAKLTLLALPLWLAGLYFYLLSGAGRRFRMLGWMYVVPLLLFIIAKGRGYYLAGAYPMLYAAGSVWGEQCLRGMKRTWAHLARAMAWTALTVDAIFFGIIAMPSSPVNSPVWKFASKLNGDLVEELGWPELAEAVAQLRDSLPASDRARLGILAGNYGEAGAINLYGPTYGLPQAISGINSFWQRGYGDPPPETLIVLGISRRFLDRNFRSCEIAGHTPNPYGINNEETSDHPDIYVCRGLRNTWPEFWNGFRYYG